ncbi:hypothetical protein [Paracraurococcus lichenis]|uniref:DUF3035 domain-containing protein n=1 Tax=Paracraurococcus lichenis TaxID=3064888 RepID=A0ABT9E892_9PROT|nr:hypothetical protein [Paracraurococcus sp. LOR1-02]MDO9712405.1 hypothetical protein [Paracraurococcus sp. LOR1-02]
MRAWPGRGGGRAGRGPWAAAALLCALAGCSVPEEVNPVAIYNRISGNDDARRPAPPGMDLPSPNLASIPPRPERPPPELRNAISAALAEDRTRSREPLLLRSIPAPGAAVGGAPRDQVMPAAPPPRASLAAAPRIPLTEAPAGQPTAAPRAEPGQGAPPRPGAAPAPALPEMPAEAPAPPPPDLLGAPDRPRL